MHIEGIYKSSGTRAGKTFSKTHSFPFLTPFLHLPDSPSLLKLFYLWHVSFHFHITCVLLFSITPPLKIFFFTHLMGTFLFPGIYIHSPSHKYTWIKWEAKICICERTCDISLYEHKLPHSICVSSFIWFPETFIILFFYYNFPS